jgi:2-haloacid dehalogenase
VAKKEFDPAAVKALTFDVFGTVVDWRSSIAREAAAFGKKHGLELDWDTFADSWRALYQPAMEKVRTGERPWVPLDVLHRQNLDRVLEDSGVSGIDEAEIANLNLAWHRLDPWPEAVEGLTRLKSRYIIGTLSNGNIALMVNMAKHTGLPWDVILGSEVARAYKPQPEAYLRSAAALGLAPEQCMMVAAHNPDLLAAAECGFRTAFVLRANEYGPHQRANRTAADGVDISAVDFNDLADQLGC